MSKAKKTTTKPKVVSKKVTTKKIVKIVNPSDSSSVQYVDLSELKGEQLMDILRKTPKYQNMNDYAIKKAIGGAKQATVPQLRAEVEKITQIPSPVAPNPKGDKKKSPKKEIPVPKKKDIWHWQWEKSTDKFIDIDEDINDKIEEAYTEYLSLPTAVEKINRDIVLLDIPPKDGSKGPKTKINFNHMMIELSAVFPHPSKIRRVKKEIQVPKKRKEKVTVKESPPKSKSPTVKADKKMRLNLDTADYLDIAELASKNKEFSESVNDKLLRKIILERNPDVVIPKNAKISKVLDELNSEFRRLVDENYFRFDDTVPEWVDKEKFITHMMKTINLHFMYQLSANIDGAYEDPDTPGFRSVKVSITSVAIPFHSSAMDPPDDRDAEDQNEYDGVPHTVHLSDEFFAYIMPTVNKYVTLHNATKDRGKYYSTDYHKIDACMYALLLTEKR